MYLPRKELRYASLVITPRNRMSSAKTYGERHTNVAAVSMPTQRRASVNDVSLNIPAGLARTVGELRAAGHSYRTVKEELRENLLTRMRAGQHRFPGIVGYDETVLPEL